MMIDALSVVAVSIHWDVFHHTQVPPETRLAYTRHTCMMTMTLSLLLLLILLLLLLQTIVVPAVRLVLAGVAVAGHLHPPTRQLHPPRLAPGQWRQPLLVRLTYCKTPSTWLVKQQVATQLPCQAPTPAPTYFLKGYGIVWCTLVGAYGAKHCNLVACQAFRLSAGCFNKMIRLQTLVH